MTNLDGNGGINAITMKNLDGNGGINAITMTNLDGNGKNKNREGKGSHSQKQVGREFGMGPKRLQVII